GGGRGVGAQELGGRWAQVGHRGRGRRARQRREIGRRVIGDDAGEARAAQRRGVAIGRLQRQVAAGRTAGEDDARRVERVLGGVGDEEGDRGLHVLQRRG